MSFGVREAAGRISVGGALLAVVMGLAVQPAMAAENLGTFDFWTAWSDEANGTRFCYISATPQDSQPTNVNRGAIHFMISSFPDRANEVSTLIGYPFHETDADASASVDGRSYPMVTEGSAAWLASVEDESAFVSAMRAGSTLIVRGTSQRGTDTQDTYSLRGVTAALNKVGSSC